MAYRAKRERGKSVETLVNVLSPAIDLIVGAPARPEAMPIHEKGNFQEDNFERFMEFFEAILAYHKAYGGS
jgi:CRISPR-associated protein Csm2